MSKSKMNPAFGASIIIGILNAYFLWAFLAYRHQFKVEQELVDRPLVQRRTASINVGSPMPLLDRPTSTGWTPMPSIPMPFMEGSCVLHRGEYWCIGGYDNDRVTSYCPLKRQWTNRPSLPDIIHHSFHGAISLEDPPGILHIGGVTLEKEKGGEPKHSHKHPVVFFNETENRWISAVEMTGLDKEEYDVGGITTCTSYPIKDEYFCTMATDWGYIKDEYRFYAFNVKTLRFRKLETPPPKCRFSHVVLAHDKVRNRLINFASRLIPNDNVAPSRWTHFFDLETERWDVEPPQKLPEYVPSLDSRMLYLDPSTKFGFLFGGQHLRGWVSDLVYRYSVSENVTDRSIHWEKWNRLPVEAQFGAAYLPIGQHDHLKGIKEQTEDAGILMIGGSNNVGAYHINRVWKWDMRKAADIFFPPELERRHGFEDDSPEKYENDVQQPIQIVAATYGRHDVTSAVQNLVNEGWSHFRTHQLPDFGLLPEWQYGQFFKNPNSFLSC